MKHFLILSLAIFFTACTKQSMEQQPNSTPPNGAKEKKAIPMDKQEQLYHLPPVEVPIENGLARAYFAGGCFWCVEAVFESIRGVDEVISGYAGGHTDDPTYEKSNTGRTGHAEAIEVFYDPKKVSFTELVDAFFVSHDPTQLNGQGPDKGSQYRAIAFFQNDEEKEIIEAHIKMLNETKYDGKVVTEIMPFQKFWVGEEYHQNYERLHPNHPYIQGVSIPRLKRFQAARPELLKEKPHE